MDEITIRRARMFDVAAVYKIEREAFTTPWSFDSLFADICLNSSTVYLVAEKAGETVAYGGMWVIFGECHITNIAVKKQARGQGLGTRLLNELIDIARKAEAELMSLEVRQSNEGAIRLYEKAGFHKIGIRNKYYQNLVENAYIMQKTMDFAPQSTL